MWLEWWDCWAPMIYHCLCACITVSQHQHDFDWNARSSFLRCVARENACGAFYLSMQWSREATAQKKYIVFFSFPQKVYEISQSFISSSGNRKQTHDTDSCLDRRDGIFFNYVLRWHCKPLAGLFSPWSCHYWLILFPKNSPSFSWFATTSSNTFRVHFKLSLWHWAMHNCFKMFRA